VRVGCSAACTITARLLVGRGSDAEVGRAPTTSLPSAGKARLVMTLSRTAWRSVRRLHARTLTLETRVVGPSGGAVTVRTPVVLTR
jgi:hypothetical protein